MSGLLRLRDFRLLWLGLGTSAFGDALTSLALLLVVQRLTGSVTAVAVTAVAIALPQVLIGLVAGVYVDRWNRKSVMVVCDLVRGVLVLGFVFVGSADRLWLLYLLAFLQAAVGTFFTPARTAILPAIVGPERLLAANSVSESTRIVCGLAGTSVAGVYASRASSLTALFVVDALTFVVSAALEARISTSGRVDAPAGGRVGAELVAGLRLYVTSPSLAGVALGAAVAMFGLGAVNVLLVPFVVDDLAVSSSWFGAFEAAQVVGMVASGVLLARLAGRVRPGSILATSLVVVGGLVAVLALATLPWHVAAVLFAAGWFVTPVQAAARTIVQQEVEVASLGRAGAAFATLTTTASVVSMAVAGAAAAALGVRGVFVVAGVTTVLAGVVAAVALQARPSPASA